MHRPIFDRLFMMASVVLIVTVFLATSSPGSVDEKPHWASIPAGAPVDGAVGHGFMLEAGHGHAPVPVLIRINGSEVPFGGEAHLVAGRAIIRLTSHGKARRPGFIVSPEDWGAGIPVSCRGGDGESQCRFGEVADGTPVCAVFFRDETFIRPESGVRGVPRPNEPDRDISGCNWDGARPPEFVSGVDLASEV